MLDCSRSGLVLCSSLRCAHSRSCFLSASVPLLILSLACFLVPFVPRLSILDLRASYGPPFRAAFSASALLVLSSRAVSSSSWRPLLSSPTRGAARSPVPLVILLAPAFLATLGSCAGVPPVPLSQKKKRGKPPPRFSVGSPSRVLHISCAVFPCVLSPCSYTQYGALSMAQPPFWLTKVSPVNQDCIGFPVILQMGAVFPHSKGIPRGP